METFVVIRYDEKTKAVCLDGDILAKVRTIKKRSGSLRFKVEEYGKRSLPSKILAGEYMEFNNAVSDIIKFFTKTPV